MNQRFNSDAEPMAKEQNVYAGVYYMLIAGMILSNILFVIGIVLALIHPQYFPLTASWVRSQYHASLVFHGLIQGQPTSFFLLGTLLLILTPVARVIVSIYAFWVDNDRKYVAVTGSVLIIIITTVILGLLGLH
jgi:uncharacterized membrane protein